MKRLFLAAAICVVALPLVACAHGQFAKDVTTLTAAGCKGAVHIDASAATASGLTVGALNGRFNFDGSCDRANLLPPPPPAP